MKKIIISLFILFPLLFAGTPPSDKYVVSPGYVVTIDGTSNLHNWTESIGTITGQGSVSWNSVNLDALSINILVHSIKSTEGSAMNNNTYKALKADTYPDIILKVNDPVKSVQNKPGASITVKASLTVAGITKVVDMQIKVLMQGKEKLTFEGSQTIKMSDYNIVPPVALFGALKTGNEITINYKTTFNGSVN